MQCRICFLPPIYYLSTCLFGLHVYSVPQSRSLITTSHNSTIVTFDIFCPKSICDKSPIQVSRNRKSEKNKCTFISSYIYYLQCLYFFLVIDSSMPIIDISLKYFLVKKYQKQPLLKPVLVQEKYRPVQVLLSRSQFYPTFLRQLILIQRALVLFFLSRVVRMPNFDDYPGFQPKTTPA